jgi:hypothetical protein
MEDEAILLKIKRQFAKDESIAALLQIISQLQFDIGVMKSDHEEEKHLLQLEINRLHSMVVNPEFQNSTTKTKKQWEQEPLFKELKQQLKAQAEKNKKTNKDLVNYRDKYFSILAKMNNTPQINPEELLQKFEERKATQPMQINNHNLPAESPMYFYCKHCGQESDVLPESYVGQPSHVCDECKILVKNNLI